MQESGIVLSRLFSTVTYCIAFQFSSESKRAISWIDKEDKLSPVAMPLIILKTFPPKILLLLPRVCRFEECTNLVATSENKWNASQSLVQNRKKKKEKKTRVPVMPDSGKKKKKRKRVAFVTANEALEWMERRPGICRSEPSLRQCTFVFEIRDDRTLLPFYNHAFSHFARIFFFSSISRRETTSILFLIRFVDLRNIAY